MNNSNNNDILGPSLSQGQVFRKQQQSRILNNNDVVTGNAVRNKNKPNKNKNGRTKISALSVTTIEPFSQNTDSINTKYKPLTLQDMERSNSVIKSVNDTENTKTQQSASSYLNVSNNLNTFQQGVTDQAKTYNTINITPGLLNKNYLTADNKNIRVNNKGVINTLNASSLKKFPQPAPGISILSTANSIPDTNYIPVENIPQGLTKGTSAGLYDKQSSSKQVNLPSRVSAYNLEGENIRVLYPYPNGVDAIKENMSYIGAFTSDGVVGISIDSTMPVETTLNCLQRAVDKGYSWCGMMRYSYSNNSQGGGGTCAIGNVTNISKYAYKVMSVSQSGWSSTLKFPIGYNLITFGADGVLYSGYNFYKFAYPLTKVFSNELDQTYGGTINDVIGSYAYNQGKWQNLKSFSGNYDPTGQPSGTFNTLYQYTIQVPNIAYYTHYYYDWLGLLQSYQAPYVYYTTQTAQELAAQNTAYGNLTYINYKCGKNPTKNPINVGGQNAGVGYNLDCTELYNKYPSFSLELNDAGVLTITNNTSSYETNDTSKKVTYDMSYGYPQTIKLANGNEVTLNMPRNDWVSDSVNGGRAIVSSSNNIHSMGPNQWISSPNGYCRLILTNGGILQLEYSLQDVSQDKDGNLVGNGLSIALYNIRNVNTTGLGTSAHVDINGGLNPYPTNMVQYDSTYTEVKGYIPNTATLNQNNGSSFSANDSDCRTACNNNPACTGYVVYGNCNLLTSENTFPTGDRVPASQYSTYVKNTKYPNNDNSCRKTLDAIVDADAYSYYLNNGILSSTMTPQTKCNLGKVLSSQMNQLKQRNDTAVQKGQEIKNQFNEIFSRENKVLDSISSNRKTSQNYDETTKNVVKEIDRIKNSQITKSASEKDSELLLVSDNYKYIILGIISLLISMATIKGLRMASS
jgi:hypothetical protein